MKWFFNAGGTHYEGSVKIESGATFQSDRALDEIHPGKFREVGAPAPVVVRTAPTPAATPAAAPDTAAPQTESVGASTGAEQPAAGGKKSGPLGTDTTASFPTIKPDDGVRVWIDAKAKYHVTDAADDTKAINDKPLTKGQVPNVVKNYLGK